MTPSDPTQVLTVPDNPMQQLPIGGQSSSTDIAQSYLSNLNTNQLSSLFQQVQAWIASNPGMAAVLGLGVLIMAMNTNQGSGRKRS